MSWITVKMDLKDNQAKVGRIFLSKFAVGTIQESQFLYKSIMERESTVEIKIVFVTWTIDLYKNWPSQIVPMALRQIPPAFA